MMKLLKILGVAALVAVPVILILKQLELDELETASEDEFDIFAEE